MPSSSLAWRALIAAAMLVGSYIFAIAIIILLLYLPIVMWQFIYALKEAEWQILQLLTVVVWFFCLTFAVTIGSAIFPRPGHFEPPGPRLKAADHPALFALLRETAKAVGQPMPAEVFLTLDWSAWVTERGGIMGFLGLRVMGLGLPLLQILSISGLRAVLAHEFGHYYGRDTRLGPWIYKTHGAIARTLYSFGGVKPIRAILLSYYSLVFRITQAICRQQEYSADAVAARAFGAEALARGLRILHGGAPAFEAYIKQEFDPVLSAGYRPPFAEGFARFIQAPNVALMIAGFLEQEVKTAKANPDDSHPLLRDRLARLEMLPAGQPFVDDPPAISLLQNVSELEKQLLAAATSKTGSRELPAVEWDEVGAVVYLPSYRKMLEEHGGVLRGITPAMLPEAMTSTRFVNYLAAICKAAPDVQAAIDQAAHFSNALIGAALVNLLIQHGWSMEVAPGMPVTLRLGGNCIEPFNILPRLVDRSLTAEAWREECKAHGIADVDLGLVPVGAEQEKKES